MTQLGALLRTLGIEGVVGGLLLWAWLGLRGRSLGRGVLVVLAASLLTHPLAWTANRSWLRGLAFPERATIIELTVVVVEATILALALPPREDGRRPWVRYVIISAAMNTASFVYGLWRLR